MRPLPFTTSPPRSPRTRPSRSALRVRASTGGTGGVLAHPAGEREAERAKSLAAARVADGGEACGDAQAFGGVDGTGRGGQEGGFSWLLGSEVKIHTHLPSRPSKEGVQWRCSSAPKGHTTCCLSFSTCCLARRVDSQRVDCRSPTHVTGCEPGNSLPNLQRPWEDPDTFFSGAKKGV